MKKIVQLVANRQMTKQVPIMNIGDTIECTYTLNNKNRDKKKFIGILIAKYNKGPASSIDVMHCHVDTKFRLLMKFLIYSPITDFVVIARRRQTPVRAKLFYLKNRSGKAVRT